MDLKKETREWPDHVQITLGMTSEQINDVRFRDRCRSRSLDRKDARRVSKLFDKEVRRAWEGTDRTYRNPKDRNYWQRQADMARGIAARKTEKKHRKYWNKVARRYEEKASTNE